RGNDKSAPPPIAVVVGRSRVFLFAPATRNRQPCFQSGDVATGRPIPEPARVRGARSLAQCGTDCAGSPGALLRPSPPAEKIAGRPTRKTSIYWIPGVSKIFKDGQSGTGDVTGSAKPSAGMK